MPAQKKHHRKEYPKDVVSSSVRDYANDPFVLKKVRESKMTLEKYGFPDALEKRWPKA
jgi:hypothetical protein